MNKEIKEILKKIKSVSNFDDYIDFVGTEFKPLLDYITNLQEGLKYQKEMYDEYCDKHTKLMQEYSNLKKENEILNKGIEYAKRIEKDYKTRFDKAIEYHNNCIENLELSKLNDNEKLAYQVAYEIHKNYLNILQGSDKE